MYVPIVPSSPLNVTWVSSIDGLVTITWQPPLYPNGIITNYIIVITLDNGDQTIFNVTGDQTSLNITRPSTEFTVTVLASNSAGISIIQTSTEPTGTYTLIYVWLLFLYIFSSDATTDVSQQLSAGVIAVVVIFCMILVLLIIAVIVTVAIVSIKRWYKFHGGTDIK